MSTDSIKSRRSVRKFTHDVVPRHVVDDILDCGRLAPTARNAQPWLLGAVTEKPLLESLAELTDHGRFIAGSAVCFVVFCLKGEKYYLEDGCAAAMNIIHASHAHGLGSCWVAGDKKPYADAVRRVLDVPEPYTLVALIPAGFPNEESQPDKKPLSKVTFKEKP